MLIKKNLKKVAQCFGMNRPLGMNPCLLCEHTLDIPQNKLNYTALAPCAQPIFFKIMRSMIRKCIFLSSDLSCVDKSTADLLVNMAFRK